MPLVRISLNQGTSPEFRRRLGDAVHRAMVETINVPLGDRFQLITEHEPGGLVYDPSYPNITRTDALVVIQISLVTGRTVEQKKRLFKRIAERLDLECGIRREDVFVGLLEVPRENWSFGCGEAQYADAAPPHLASPQRTEAVCP
jgi:4-oxalocrotonate tautomerase